MAREKKRTILVAIAYLEDAILLLPQPGSFDLPHFQKRGCLKRCLRRELLSLGFDGISLLAKLDPIEEERDGEKVRIIGCVFTYETMAQKVKPLPVSSKPEDAPEMAAKFLWRCDIYAPRYQNKPRTVPFLPPEAKKVEAELDFLSRNVRRIGKKRLNEFRLLCDSAASIRRVNEAFAQLCNQFHIRPVRNGDAPAGKDDAAR